MHGRYYIVSSTWRNNASVFEPTGRIHRTIKEPQQILVQELDLSYALLPWSGRLANGNALRKIYGEKVGFRYYQTKTLEFLVQRPSSADRQDDPVHRVTNWNRSCRESEAVPEGGRSRNIDTLTA